MGKTDCKGIYLRHTFPARLRQDRTVSRLRLLPPILFAPHPQSVSFTAFASTALPAGGRLRLFILITRKTFQEKASLSTKFGLKRLAFSRRRQKRNNKKQSPKESETKRETKPLNKSKKAYILASSWLCASEKSDFI